ncbi:target of Nesh-SH3-like [Alosa pseudoharengus]|uniref:target of Nesh-SH3-like n=1 Tax=Alosa pseudoharengus TaxID=34774 RepID=UPI003F8BF79E
MLTRIFLTVLCNLLLAVSGSTQDTTGEEKLRVQINATGDTIVLRFIRPQESVRLEGYVLGYGGSMFSKQYIQLPNDGQPYHGEMDAEPKYLISVQPIKPNEVKKQCPGKLDLQRPLHLVIGSVTPTKVMLSWGTLLKTPYTFTTDDCPQDGQYTIRYREQDTTAEPTPEPTPEPTQAPDRQWKYQTCPSSSTVIEQLKPNTPYEFEVRADTEEGASEWTPPVVHNTNVSVTEKLVSLIEKGNKEIEKPFKPPVIPILPGPKETFVVRPVPLPRNLSLPGNRRILGRGSQRPGMWLPGPRPSVTTLLRTRRPRPGPAPVINRPRSRNSTFSPRKTDVAVEGMQGVTLTKPAPKARNGSSVLKPRLRPLKNGLNQVVKPKQEDKGRVHVKHVDPEPALKAIAPPITRETTSQTPQKAPTTTTTTTSTTTTTTTTTQAVQATTPFSYFNATRFDSGENASIFSPEPTSKMDAMGKERFTAPHVIYQTDKAPEEPCSITQTLSHFPEDEPSEVNVTAPPRLPPTNLTVVAVEGCPSFVILDWEKADNETTEYEVTSSTKGPEGKEVSILVTNKTHTAVENLKPESRYEFTVTPKNELGVGPSTEPVTFSTESADPRVAEVTGKRAIWSTFPFKLDMSSECNGPQYIKRTWYRKFVGIQLCNSLRYKIYLSDSLRGPFYHIGDQSGHGEDHCQFVDSFLDGRTGSSTPFNKLPETEGFYRAMRQEPVEFGTIGGNSHINYVSWYECGVAIPGKW